MTQIDTAHLQSWIGKTQIQSDTITPFAANALAATLNRDDPAYEPGMALPPLWHWLYFLDVFRMDEAGYDGHAALGRFLPPVPLPRRMWAGSRLIWHHPIRIGAQMQKRSTIRDVSHRKGRSGDLVFVTVAHELYEGDVRCLSEEHDIVYRGRPNDSTPAQTPKPAPENAGAERLITPSPVLLFRYSALTFNGHRIHYDDPFCKGTEGYDGLVAHGPLLATLMLDLLRRERPAASLRSFEFRAKAPVTGMTPFHSALSWDGISAADLWIKRGDGAEAMRGRATWEAGT